MFFKAKQTFCKRYAHWSKTLFVQSDSVPGFGHHFLDSSHNSWYLSGAENGQNFSENKGLDKSRSVSNLIKISVPVHLNFFSVHLIFFSVCHLNFFQVYDTNLKKIQLTNWKKIQVYWKKIQVCRTWNFSKVWNRP